MAEFHKVLNDYFRMCDAQCNAREDGCIGCPLNKDGRIGSADECNVYIVAHNSDAEPIIEDWAAQHLEPQYPTWKEWYESTFPDQSVNGFCLRTFMPHRCESVTCADCYNEHIPADIAEKLHISPVERSDKK